MPGGAKKNAGSPNGNPAYVLDDGSRTAFAKPCAMHSALLRRGDLDEVSFHKGPAGTGLQVLLKGECPVLVRKAEGSNTRHRQLVFGEVHLALRMAGHSLIQVARASHVVVPIGAQQDVNMKFQDHIEQLWTASTIASPK